MSENLQSTLIILYRAVGAGIAIGIMELLAIWAAEPMVRVPFVTSIVLAMGIPDSAPARPSAIVGGHLLSCLSGFLVIAIMGHGETQSAIAVGLATAAMLATGLLHPPAGICAFLVATYGLPWGWLLSPVLVGALLLAAFATVWSAGEQRLTQPSPTVRP